MPMLIMLSLYFGLLICVLLFLHNTNRIKMKTRSKTKYKATEKGYKKSNVKFRFKSK